MMGQMLNNLLPVVDSGGENLARDWTLPLGHGFVGRATITSVRTNKF
jgi:hypothetical protein